MSAVLEYPAADVLELAENAARDNKKGCIQPRHLQLAVRNHRIEKEELNTLLGDVTFREGGVQPRIGRELHLKKPEKFRRRSTW